MYVLKSECEYERRQIWFQKKKRQMQLEILGPPSICKKSQNWNFEWKIIDHFCLSIFFGMCYFIIIFWICLT